MPEFILDMGDPDTAHRFNALDSFTQGYIEAAFFTSTGPDNEEEGLGEGSVAELAPDTLADIVADCAKWQADQAGLLQAAYDYPTAKAYDARRAGNDYWYTRNGHGTGFWDRGLGDVGDKLAAACHHHSVDMCRGDDGLIYFT